MVGTSFDDERDYDDDRFAAARVARTDRQQVILGYFRPGQFIPVHAPDSDLAVVVHAGDGVVREGDDEHAVGPGDVVVVETGVERGIRAGDDGLEAALVTAPPPTAEEHEPVHEGLARGEFEP